MRMSMPLEYRSIVTEVLGELQFNFYHRWFDVIFLVSALSSILFLYLAHKQAPEKHMTLWSPTLTWPLTLGDPLNLEYGEVQNSLFYMVCMCLASTSWIRNSCLLDVCDGELMKHMREQLELCGLCVMIGVWMRRYWRNKCYDWLSGCNLQEKNNTFYFSVCP